MKQLFNKILIIIVLTMVALTCKNANKVNAHPALLDVYYEDPANATGAWYYLYTDDWACIHFDGSTVKYVIANELNDPTPAATPEESNWYWITPRINAEDALELQNAVVTSMKKWDAFYIGKKVNGEPIKSKLINFTLGSMEDYNLCIQPDRRATTAVGGLSEDPRTLLGIEPKHIHSTRFDMYIMLATAGAFKSYEDQTEYNVLLSRLGAHEFGHVLGLLDLDTIEHGSADYDWHHNDKIMGYAQYGEYADYQSTISYYDLIGAGVARGLHTDNDHKWRVEGTKGDLTVLECYVCNGRVDLALNSDETYGPNHVTAIAKIDNCAETEHISSKMEYVASTLQRDYLKCKHCDYYRTYTHRIGTLYHFNPQGHYRECSYCGQRFQDNHDFELIEQYYVCTVCNYRTRVAQTNSDNGEILYNFSDDQTDRFYDISQAEIYILENDNYDLMEKMEILEEIAIE